MVCATASLLLPIQHPRLQVARRHALVGQAAWLGALASRSLGFQAVPQG